MKQVNTAGIIYKMMRYSDRSAVALAFSPEYGKLKLFMPRAYSSKGGFMTFVPGSITFNMKETSDLHKFESFGHNPEFYYYTQVPEIMMRMHLVYDFYDHLFHIGEASKVLWQLSQKFTEDNYREVALYSIYRLLREAGIMFDTLCECGKMSGEYYLYGGQFFCSECVQVAQHKALPVSADICLQLQSFGDNERFRSLSFSADNEKQILQLFSAHVDSVLGKNDILKSLKVFMSMN